MFPTENTYVLCQLIVKIYSGIPMKHKKKEKKINYFTCFNRYAATNLRVITYKTNQCTLSNNYVGTLLNI